jgi:methylthioribose-1-phosphate isomerase
LIIAAIGILIGLVVWLCKEEDKEAEALKAANEALKSAEEAYNTAATAAQNFKEAVSDYSEAIEGIKELEAGTKEMADAVEDANEKAMKLIETYGLWGKFDYGANGEIIIDKGALADAEQELETRESKAKAGLASARVH